MIAYVRLSRQEEGVVSRENHRGKLGFGSLLRHFRRRSGLTQEALGDLIEISKPVISHYECGFRLPGRATMGRIRNVLGLTPEEYVSLMDAANG